MSSSITEIPLKFVRHEPGVHTNMPNDIEKKMTRQKSQTVRFSPSSILQVYEAPLNQSGGSSWYSPQEHRLFKQQKRYEVSILQWKKNIGCDIYGNGTFFPDICPVGLEWQLISREFAKMRIEKKRLVTRAVLIEQLRSVTSVVDNKQERIANASRKHSEWSRVQSQAIGSFQANRRITHN